MTAGIDIRCPGRQHGVIDTGAAGCAKRPSRSDEIVAGCDDSARRWDRRHTPITVVGDGSSETAVILCSASGPDDALVATWLNELGRTLDPARLHGSVIVLPCLDSIEERDRLLATLALEPRLVLTLSTASTTMNIAPMALVRPDDPGADSRASEAAMIAFGAPNSVRLYSGGKARHTGPVSAESCAENVSDTHRGAKLVKPPARVEFQASLGGDPLQLWNILRRGCLNALIQLGVLDGELELAATRLLRIVGNETHVHAPGEGTWIPRARVDGSVYGGDPLGLLSEPRRPGKPVESIDVPHDGILLACRHPGRIEPGNCLALIGDELQA